MTVGTDTGRESYALTSDHEAQAIIEQGYALRALMFADRLAEVSEAHLEASDRREREDAQWFEDTHIFRGARPLSNIMAVVPNTKDNRIISKYFLRYVRSVTKGGAYQDHLSGDVRERISSFVNIMRNRTPAEYALAMVQ